MAKDQTAHNVVVHIVGMYGEMLQAKEQEIAALRAATEALLQQNRDMKEQVDSLNKKLNDAAPKLSALSSFVAGYDAAIPHATEESLFVSDSDLRVLVARLFRDMSDGK